MEKCVAPISDEFDVLLEAVLSLVRVIQLIFPFKLLFDTKFNCIN